MKRIEVWLTDDLHAVLSNEARIRGLSEQEIVRETLARALQPPPTERRSIPFIALGRSGYHDTSQRIDEILAEEWSRHIDQRE